MADSGDEFVDANDVILFPVDDGVRSNSLLGPVYWCRSCNMQVVPRGGRVVVCPDCEGENIIPLGTLGLSSPSANGLRYRGRHRAASDSDLFRLGGNDEDWRSPLSLSGVLMGHNQSRSNNALFMPAPRIPWYGRWANDLLDDWEDVRNNNSRLFSNSNGYEQDDRFGYLSTLEASSRRLPNRPWDARSPPLHVGNAAPTWQQFMREMLQNLLRGGGDRGMSVPGDHMSDPGDYMDDSRGFERLLSELAENDSDNHGPPPAAKSAVNKLPFIAIEQQHIDDDSATCPVCKDRMELGEMAKELPCQHLYHESCILPWLDFRNSCPVCRFELPTDDADYEARKRAAANNSRSMTGQQERGGANGTGLRVMSAREEAERRVEEFEDEFETYPVQQSRRSGGWRYGWLWGAARPLLSIVGIVLAFTFGHRLIRAQEPIGNQLAMNQLSDNPIPNIEELILMQAPSNC